MENKVFELRKYFSGGLAPGILQNQNIEFIRSQVERANDGDKILELLLIGLTGYTESFYKNFFASSINLFLFLAQRLVTTNKRLDIRVFMEELIRDFFYYELNFTYCFGDFLSDKFKFDKATDINKSFSILLDYKPFSDKEIDKFQEIRDKRNLFAHNGGLMNSNRSAVLKQFSRFGDPKNQTFLSIGKWQTNQYIEFIEETSKRFLGKAQETIRNIINEEIESGRYFNIDTSDWEFRLSRLVLWEPLMIDL